MSSEQLSVRQQLRYIMLGISIGVFYTGLFILVTTTDWENFEFQQIGLIQDADAQIILGLLIVGLAWNDGKPVWNKGKKMPQGFSERIRDIRTGWKLSESTRKKISVKLKGNKNPLGCKRSEETKRILSEQKKGKSNHREGTHHKPETILKIKAQKGWKHSEETKEKMKKIRATIVMPLRNTKPERLFRKALEEKEIKFKQGKLIQTTPKDFYHQVDFFIEPNICVEIDGTYWHQLPNVIIRDKEVNERLKGMGYLVIRYPATDKFNQQTANNFVNNLMEVII